MGQLPGADIRDFNSRIGHSSPPTSLVIRIGNIYELESIVLRYSVLATEADQLQKE